MLAIVSRSEAELLAEDAGKMTLVGEAALGRDLRQALPAVNQGPACHPEPELAQVFLRRHVERRLELPLEGADRHMGEARELPVRDRRLEVVAQVGQDRAELGAW